MKISPRTSMRMVELTLILLLSYCWRYHSCHNVMKSGLQLWLVSETKDDIMYTTDDAILCSAIAVDLTRCRGVEYKTVARNITVAINYLLLLLVLVTSESLLQVPSSMTVVTPVLSHERSPVILTKTPTTVTTLSSITTGKLVPSLLSIPTVVVSMTSPRGSISTIRSDFTTISYITI